MEKKNHETIVLDEDAKGQSRASVEIFQQIMRKNQDDARENTNYEEYTLPLYVLYNDPMERQPKVRHLSALVVLLIDSRGRPI